MTIVRDAHAHHVPGTFALSLTAIGAQLSVPGVKHHNDDCIGMRLPSNEGEYLRAIVAAIADGVSTSKGGKHAAEICVQGFLSDLFATPETWPIKRSGQKVLESLNRWLFGLAPQGGLDREKHLCTFSAIAISEGNTHIFHVGDTRVWRVREGKLQQLTVDQREEGSRALQNAMGAIPQLRLSYAQYDAKPNDLYLLTTDGVHDWISPEELLDLLTAINSPEQCVKEIVAQASRRSNDNLSVQVLKLVASHTPTTSVMRSVPFGLTAGSVLDHFKIEKRLYESSRSELFLATDTRTYSEVVLKIPSALKQDDTDHLEHFLREQWLLKQIKNPHIVQSIDFFSAKWIYSVMLPVKGVSLRQWLNDQSKLDLAAIVSIITQTAQALQHLHRLGILHLDIKPENIMISETGHVTLIDLGSACHGNLSVNATRALFILSGTTLPYSAPELTSQHHFSPSADLYSLGMVAHELLLGKLPEKPRQTRTGKAQSFPSLSAQNHFIPQWIDGAVRRACHPDITQRHEALSEFVYELHHPNPSYTISAAAPLVERSPETFWKMVSLLEAIAIVVLLLAWTQA